MGQVIIRLFISGCKLQLYIWINISMEGALDFACIETCCNLVFFVAIYITLVPVNY